MILLILGILLWVLPHMFKRLAPRKRLMMEPQARSMVAGLVVVGLVLMVIGYRMADGAVFWGRSPMLVGINNLMVLFAVYLFAADGMKTRAKGWFRNPQLTAFKIWALGHLLVNGDMASFVLFGGLLAWAVVEVILLNRANPRPPKPAPAPIGKEIGAIVGAVAVYGVIALIHTWLGYPTFG